MIVTEDQMHAAVAVINDADGTAEVHFQATMAENYAKETFAKIFLSYTGAVEERKARATCNPETMEAKALEAEALRSLERRKADLRSAELIVEIWRTENANARAVERIR